MSLLALKYFGVAICLAASPLRKCQSVKINASRMDAEFDGMATGLSTAITKDGQTTVTADLPMATYKHTAVGNAAARTDYAAAGQIQDGALNAVAGGGAADVQTLTPAPSITAFAAYQRFWFLPVADNTGACTLNVSAVGAKNIKITDGAGGLTDPAAGDLDTVIVADVVYDGTQFILQNPATFAPDADLTAIAALAHTNGHSIYSDGSAGRRVSLMVQHPTSLATRTCASISGPGHTLGCLEARLLFYRMGGIGSGGRQVKPQGGPLPKKVAAAFLETMIGSRSNVPRRTQRQRRLTFHRFT